MRKTLFALLALVLVAACQHADADKQPAPTAEPYDSAALHLAVMPVAECLPLYYAAERGMFQAAGIKVQLHTYTSQLECDTAYLHRSLDGGLADPLRMQALGKRSATWMKVAEVKSPQCMVVNSALRLRSLDKLKGRTLAATRQSVEQAALLDLLHQGRLKEDDIYRPQINNPVLRTTMVMNGQVEGGVLAWPYVSVARAQGHKVLGTAGSQVPARCFVLVPGAKKADALRKAWQGVDRIRRQAIDSLHAGGAGAASHVLQTVYGVPQQVADTLRFP